jgi:hypothetical protein
MEPTPDPHAVFAAIQKLSQEQVCALLFAASQHSNDVAERILETVAENPVFNEGIVDEMRQW